MSSKRPAVGGGVLWFVPKRKRPVAETTKASEDLVYFLVESGYTSYNKIKDANNFDSDIDELCEIMVKLGHGDSVLSCGPFPTVWMDIA